MKTNVPQAVGVRFSKGSRVYSFDASSIPEIEPWDFVLVETNRGKQVGQVVKLIQDYRPDGQEPLKPVLRRANAAELALNESIKMTSGNVLEFCKEWAKREKLLEVKFIGADINFDRSYLLLTYATATDERVDLKSLRSEIQSEFSIGNVEIKQLGPRDLAKAIGGIGSCGKPECCCKAHLVEFSSISIRMAKAQGISLTPTEITGMCGRLRCCMEYENDIYVENRKLLPKKKKKVMTPQGEGKVVEVFPMTLSVLVEIPEVGRRQFTRDQITYEDVPPTPQPAQQSGRKGKNRAVAAAAENEDEDE